MVIRGEYNVNDVFQNGDRICRVNSVWREPSMGLVSTTLAPIGPILARDYPEVECQTRLYHISATLHVGKKNLRQDVLVADPTAVGLFDFPLRSGDARTALSSPRSVLISERLAGILFNTPEALGKTIRFDTFDGAQVEYTVTAVRKELPFNSVTNFGDRKYDLILPFGVQGDFISPAALDSWGSKYIMTFVKLRPQSSIMDLQAKLTTFIALYAPIPIQGTLQIELAPLKKLYLDDDNGIARRSAHILAWLGVAILSIAGVNSVNLATARSLVRAKGAAIRRVIGAQRHHIVAQQMTESLLICLFAMVLAVLITEATETGLLPHMSQPLGHDIRWDLLSVAIVVVISLTVGVISGCYPGMVVSSFEPMWILKGQVHARRRGTLLHLALVVGQFTVAIVLMICVIGMSHQLSFLTTKELGFVKKDVLVIESVPREWNLSGVTKMDLVKQQLLSIPGVESGTLSFDTPTGHTVSTVSVRVPGSDSNREVEVALFVVDDDYAATYGLSLVEGRFFSRTYPAEADAVVINEAAARALGLQSPVGSGVIGVNGEGATICGVVKDFHFESMHRTIRPLCFVSVRRAPHYRYLSLRLSNNGAAQVVNRIHDMWQRLLPSAPFESSFVEAQIDQQYKSDQKTQVIVRVATVLAFAIACMGMFALASISAARRVKEVGVRKVLGASISHTAIILSRQFLVWVVISNIFAFPIAWYAMHKWLEDFAYSVGTDWWVFALAGTMSLLIALFTVGTQAIKAALANPVDALRYE
jgi:putative ABC transport system permease protein